MDDKSRLGIIYPCIPNIENNLLKRCTMVSDVMSGQVNEKREYSSIA